MIKWRVWNFTDDYATTFLVSIRDERDDIM